MKALYLEPDEEITSVVDRLKAIDDQEVAIVVPKRAGILQSIINLKLLRRQSEAMGKRLSIVTTDKTGRNLASAVGLTVHQRLPEVDKVTKTAAVDKPGTPVAIAFKKKPEAVKPPTLETHAIEDAAPSKSDTAKDKGVKSENTGGIAVPVKKVTSKEKAQPAPEALDTTKKVSAKKRTAVASKRKLSLAPLLRRRRFLLVLTAGILAFAAVSGYVFLPKATIAVAPTTQPLEASSPVIFSARATAYDQKTNTVPSKVIEITKDASATVDTTGTSNAGEKASGELVVVNTLSKTQPLVTRTRFEAPNGRIFRTQSAVTVPAGGQQKVSVTADDGGEDGNLPAGTRLSVPGLGGSDAVYGQVETALSGGTSTPGSEVAKADVDKARAALAISAAENGFAEAKQKLAVGFAMSPQVVATTILASTASPKIGSAGKTVTVTGRVQVRYFTYAEEDYRKVRETALNGKVPTGSDVVDAATKLSFAATNVSADTLTGTLIVQTAVTQQVSKEEIKRAVEGKSLESAREALRALGINEVKITLSPFWVRAVPKRDRNVTIIFIAAESTPTPSPSAAAQP
jgi:hypothetical protein